MALGRLRQARALPNELDAFEPASKAAGSNNPPMFARKESAFFDEVRFLISPASNVHTVDAEEGLLIRLWALLKPIQLNVVPLRDDIMKGAAFIRLVEAKLWDESLLPASRLTASGLEEAAAGDDFGEIHPFPSTKCERWNLLICIEVDTPTHSELKDVTALIHRVKGQPTRMLLREIK